MGSRRQGRGRRLRGLWLAVAALSAASATTRAGDSCVPPTYSGLLYVDIQCGFTAVTWTSGTGSEFDVVRGDLPTLIATGGNFTAALDVVSPASDVCLLNNSTALIALDLKASPSPGGGWFYLLRAVDPCGAVGTYDSGAPTQIGARDAEIAAAFNECP